MEYTLSIIKPDATQRNITGQINSIIEGSGLKIVAQKMLKLTPSQAQGFYAEHEGKAFFDGLVEVMSSGNIIVQVLQGEDAISKYRTIMGTTNPATAEEGTIRKTFGLAISQNSVHGSDSPESAEREISYFFAKTEICK